MDYRIKYMDSTKFSIIYGSRAAILCNSLPFPDLDWEGASGGGSPTTNDRTAKVDITRTWLHPPIWGCWMEHTPEQGGGKDGGEEYVNEKKKDEK